MTEERQTDTVSDKGHPRHDLTSALLPNPLVTPQLSQEQVSF